MYVCMWIAQGRATFVVVVVVAVAGAVVAVGGAAVVVGAIGAVPTSGLAWRKHSIAVARRVGLCLWS